MDEVNNSYDAAKSLEERISKLADACDLKIQRLSELDTKEEILKKQLKAIMENFPKESTFLKGEVRLSELKLESRK